MPAKNTKATAAVASKNAVGATLDENVFLFIPNLIGYTRIILAAGALYYMPVHPKTCMLMYSISCLLDAVDGQAARYYDQCSKFGAILDMVTDSSLTSGATSHKKISESGNFILRAYYSNNLVLFGFCFANELFFVILYLFSFEFQASAFGKIVLYTLAVLTGPVCAGKQIISCIQFANAAKSLAQLDVEERKQAKKN
ncbi:CDP-diacylglycerol-inositol 3-phosphatidyltransferase [Mortierella claussenii]|nr:CDP-diacylglycerol-inositol 3-phosphatidyltransferase [Mortierella claussenii]